MGPLLIDIKQLSKMIGLCPRGARELCRRHGIEPINVGLGKKIVLRWQTDAVMQLVSTLQAKVVQNDVVPRRSSRSRVLGKSAEQLLCELSNALQ